MSHIVFHHDTVLSDVHVRMPHARRPMTRVNSAGQPVFVSRFRILTDRDTAGLEEAGRGGDKDTEDSPRAHADFVLDDDGDLDVTHRLRAKPDREVICPVILQQTDPEPDLDDDYDDTCSKDVIKIEHTMATPLEDVGKQVWRGAFLLADFILSEPDMFAGATVLELGAGTGLASIVMATTAATVYCTDVGEDLLGMCGRNVTSNSHVTHGEVKVRHLDWLQEKLRMDEDLDFSWTQEEVTHMLNNTRVIMAADVCYDNELTDGLFRTVSRLCRRFRHGCSIFFSIERRYNFTLRHLCVSCEAYDHFRRSVEQLRALGDGACEFKVQLLASNFPQALQYERVEQLELWRVTATQTKSVGDTEPPEPEPGTPPSQTTAGLH